MNESNVPARPTSCPRCGARASIVSNPFYGVGLAVHSHLWSCSRCDFVALLSAQKGDGDFGADGGSPPTPGRRARGRVERLLPIGRWWAYAKFVFRK